MTITGTAAEDQVLGASNDLADADGLGPISYQWQRNSGSGFADIIGVAASTYVLGDADVGATVRVLARYTDAHGTMESVASAATSTVLNVNDAPMVAHAILDQSLAEDTAWSYQAPANTFSDVDGDTLSYTAALGNGDQLPAWLSFNAATRTFSGTPAPNFNGAIDLKMTASDGTLSASDTFTLTVTPVNDAPVVAHAIVDQSLAEDFGMELSGSGQYVLGCGWRYALLHGNARQRRSAARLA